MNQKEEFQQQNVSKMVIAPEVGCSAIQNPFEENSHLQNEILNHVANSSAVFKSQQRDEPELSFQEKRTIALDLLEKSPSEFLSKFGYFLKVEHLSYFRSISDDEYEISFYLKRLDRYFDKEKRFVDVRNRRYEALKSLVDKGEYFSETEMMNRNPLLYNRLVGRYLTSEEKLERDNIDTKNISFANLLIETIDRNILRDLEQKQKDAEDEVDEECDTDDENERENDSVRTDEDTFEIEEIEIPCIPSDEQKILKQEFISHMYQSFLDGKDEDFDYRYFTVHS